MTIFRVHDEYQYLQLVRNILDNGHTETGRNGPVKSLFGAMMRFSLADNTLPILTTKRMAWTTCFKELLWFIRGSTDNDELNAEGVHIWDANASREFISAANLSHYADGLLGPIYGYQWRHYNAEYDPCTGTPQPYSQGIDQLQYIINQLRDPATRHSRRLVMTAWNPCQIMEMALPPCHMMCQFYVHDDNKLSCLMFQRSGDMALGVPFNIASYSLLTHLIANATGLVAWEFIHTIGNAHVYMDHIQGLKEQLTREPFPFPSLHLTRTHDKLEEYTMDDLHIDNYVHHPKITFPMHA